MRRKWTVGDLETLAQLCPESGEHHVTQLFQWEHDVSKTWALALLGAAFAFIGSAALSLLEDDVEASSVTTWVFVTAGAAAILISAWTLRRLHDLPPEYLRTLHRFSRARGGRTMHAPGAVLATVPYLVAMTVVAVLFIGAMIVVGAGFVVSWKRNRDAARKLESELEECSDQAVLLAKIRETPISVLLSDDALYRKVDDVLAKIDQTPTDTQNLTPHRGSAVLSNVDVAAPRSRTRISDSRSASSERAYDIIDATLANVPRTIPEHDANPPQKQVMESLAEALAPVQEPFRSWSKRFKNAAEDLGSVVPMRTRLPELLDTPLRAKAHFDMDFYEGVNEVRARANDRDDLASGAAIEKLVASVTEWVQLTNDWYDLRKDAAERIAYKQGWDDPWHGWLKHVAVDFVEPETGSPMVWWQSSLLSRSDSLVRLSAWIVREIEDRIKDRKWREADFSAICSMSSTGVPLATLLSARFRKRLLVVDEGAEFHFPPGFEPKKDDHILMVDSNMSTGTHLARCARRINDAGAFVMGAVLICKDDLPHKTREPIIEVLESEDRLIRLFTLSDIYQAWKVSRA